MTYSKNFVAAIKVNGKVMVDAFGEVRLPFGSEYSIMLKNLGLTKAVVKISIDGKPFNYDIIVSPGETTELERTPDLSGGGYKFKFIERTEAINKHRGVKLEDGVIRIEYQFEKPYTPPVTWVSTCGFGKVNDVPPAWWGVEDVYFSSGPEVTCGSSATTTHKFMSNITTQSITRSNDAGITVNGNDSNQQFCQGYVSTLEYQKHVITFILKGQLTDPVTQVVKPVLKPFTVKAKNRCSSCGKVNKITNKFCSECGTRLV